VISERRTPAQGPGAQKLRALLGTAGALPAPGSGRTAQRWHRLLAWGRADLPMARLAEGHKARLRGQPGRAGRRLRPDRRLSRVTSGEEHALLALLRRHGHRVLSPTDVHARTSARLHGRARGGLADLLLDLATGAGVPLPAGAD
jgi:hypothetical protein